MPVVQLPDGQNAEFPDSMPLDQIKSVISKKFPSQQTIQNGQSQNNNDQRKKDILNMGLSTGDFLQDLGAGAMRGGQNIAALLGEGGNALASLLTGGYAPKVNIREEMGLGKNRPVDLGSMFASKKANPLVMGLGQYAPAIIAGGTTLPGQATAMGLYGAAQAQPDQQNAFGLLPQGRGGAAIESAALAGLPFAIPKAIGGIKSFFNKYLTPETTAKNYLNKLGGGQSVTDNIKELSKRLSYGQKTAKQEALLPKRQVMMEQGEDRIFPSQITGKKLTDQVADIFSSHPDELNDKNLYQLSKSLKDYYKGNNDIQGLIEKGEDIFDHPGLEDKDIDKLEGLLIPQKPVKGEYLKIKNPDRHYSEILQEAHDAYASSPTFANSDKLRSRLFKRINELSKRDKVNTLTDSQEKELSSLNKNRSAIIKDQENLISTFSPENQQKYGQFNKLWREDVKAYENAGSTVKNLKNGFLDNVTPDKITNAFAFSELKPQLQKALKDIGPSGINNIIYNELSRTPTAKGIVNTLNDLETHKGFSPYITQEMRNLSHHLKGQLRNKNALKWALGGVASLGAVDLAYQGGKKVLNAL
jgi:hypothetical protein